MSQQLAFDLPANVRLGADDFFVSAANELAYSMLHTPDGWPNAMLALVGPPGSGKTHLARIFAAQTGAQTVNARDVTADQAIPTGPLVLEDGEHLRSAGEEWLFHSYNLMARERHGFLMTAAISPARWDVTLPDLRSRVSAITTVSIGDPDDALLTAVLLKHFADRQLAPAPDAVAYMLKRLPRSFQALRETVEHLDHAALAQGKALTRPFVRDVLDTLGQTGP